MRLIATFFYVGLLRPAPGTWGSLAALPVAYALLLAGGFWLLLAATVAVFVLGWIATDRVTAGMVNHDPSWIVIDEVAGQWLVLIVAPLDPAFYALGFVLFRFADITKPWPANWAERRLPGGLGIMADDIVAGIYAGVVVWAVADLITP